MEEAYSESPGSRQGGYDITSFVGRGGNSALTRGVGGSCVATLGGTLSLTAHYKIHLWVDRNSSSMALLISPREMAFACELN